MEAGRNRQEDRISAGICLGESTSDVIRENGSVVNTDFKNSVTLYFHSFLPPFLSISFLIFLEKVGRGDLKCPLELEFSGCKQQNLTLT